MTASIDEDTPATPAAPEDGIESPQDSGAPTAAATWRRSLAARWRLLATVCFLVLSMAIAALVFFGPHRDGRETAAASAQALAAAQEGAVALLSYAPASLDQDLATARSHLTGDFLTYFSQFADQILIPAAKEKDVHASATVVRAAVMDAHPASAHVLLFINQTTTSRDNPTSAQAASSVKVGLTKVDGTWRISSFDPA